LFTFEEQALFQSRYTLKVFCDNCDVHSSIETPVMINYISDHGLGQLENLHDWPNLLDPLVNNKTLQCSCEKLCDAFIDNFTLPKICLIEFSKDSSLILGLREQILIQDHFYVLVSILHVLLQMLEMNGIIAPQGLLLLHVADLLARKILLFLTILTCIYSRCIISVSAHHKA